MTTGDYYKIRTKKWLEGKGYQVAFLEKAVRIFAEKRIIYVKRDQFASDLLAVNEYEIIFVQAKFNARQKSKNVATAVREFHKFRFPKFVKKWIVIWQKRKREPEIVEV